MIAFTQGHFIEACTNGVPYTIGWGYFGISQNFLV
jgi:hypothetical protein